VFGGAFDVTGEDLRGSCRATGFQPFEMLHLAGLIRAEIASA
jgi:hypothetical protein